MSQHAVRNAILGIPLAALSFGRAAEAVSPITAETISPPAATQVMTSAELAQSHMPALSLSTASMPRQGDQSRPTLLHRVARILPIALAMGILTSRRRDRDSENK